MPPSRPLLIRSTRFACRLFLVCAAGLLLLHPAFATDSRLEKRALDAPPVFQPFGEETPEAQPARLEALEQQDFRGHSRVSSWQAGRGATPVPDESEEGETTFRPRLYDLPRLGEPPVGTPPPVRGEPAWEVLDRREVTTRVFKHGSWEEMTRRGLGTEDYRVVIPPTMEAALGIATVDSIDNAGWFMSAGRRLNVKTSDAENGFITRSYESWALVGWAAGVTSGALPSARIHYDAGFDTPVELFDLIDRAISEGGESTGAWLVTGQVDFERIEGQALRQAPLPEQPFNDRSDRADETRSLFGPVADANARGLVTALVANPFSETGRLLVRDLLTSQPARVNSRRILAHYALLRDPAPDIDPRRPFQAIWEGSHRRKDFPRVRTVRRALEGGRVQRANLSIFSLDGQQPFPEPEPVVLVDVTETDPTVLTEQFWANPNLLYRDPLYKRSRFLLRQSAAEALARVSNRLREQGYRLKLYDAYRPFHVTQKLWRDHAKPGYLAAPNVGSRHNRGCAVDCTLADLEGREVEMPSEVLTFSDDSHRDNDSMTTAAQRNLAILTNAMWAEGFSPIRMEWWHYDAPGWQTCRVINAPLWSDDRQSTLTTALQPLERLQVAHLDPLVDPSTTTTARVAAARSRQRRPEIAFADEGGKGSPSAVLASLRSGGPGAAAGRIAAPAPAAEDVKAGSSEEPPTLRSASARRELAESGDVAPRHVHSIAQTASSVSGGGAGSSWLDLPLRVLQAVFLVLAAYFARGAYLAWKR